MTKSRHEKRPQAPASNEVFLQIRSIFSFDVDDFSTIVCCSTCRNADLSLLDAGVGRYGQA